VPSARMKGKDCRGRGKKMGTGGKFGVFKIIKNVVYVYFKID